jgi:acyl transferase domain-containing protein
LGVLAQSHFFFNVIEKMKLAIVGLACRFPGSSNSPKEYFENLLNSKDCIVDIPEDRWNKDFFFNPEKNTPGKMVVKKGGFMDNLFEFDNECFSMSVKEASNIDPQQKILLEVALQALEDSNLKYRGSQTGVFIGTGQVDFSELSLSKVDYINEYTAPGSALSIHANLLSYKLDLRGPSMSVDTACSSSATAMYLASLALKNGDCEQAVVGGINMILNHGMSIAFSKLGVLSVEGKCRSFDADAQGYVRSEGCGVVVVKPYEKAIQDGDNIYCVISSVCSNEDGALSPSLTMPSEEAQGMLMRKTLFSSKIPSSDMYYVEAHATGTLVGDPIEVNTIANVFAKDRTSELKVGSVKSNIGHCECASYMASLIKVALMVKNKTLVPSIHFKTPNPKINFDNMAVQTKQEIFDPVGKFFGISSFGFGGANVFTILEGVSQAPKEIGWQLPSPYLFILQGQTENALRERINRVKGELHEKNQHQVMVSLNNQYQEGYRYSSFAIGPNVGSVEFVDVIRKTAAPPLCMVFSGQGPQNLKMGRGLFKAFPHFRKVIEQCDALYQKSSGISLIHDVGLFGDFVGKPEDVHRIDITLPSLIFLQIALFELWKYFGVQPTVVMGHSFGEMCSIYASGACSLEDVMVVTATRAKLMTQLDKQGTMLAVGCGADQINGIIETLKVEKIWIAAYNSPISVTLGGIVESIQAVQKYCDAHKIFARTLNVTNAYHTPLLSSLRDVAIKEFSSVVHSKKPIIPIISTITGEYEREGFSAEYFWKNVENAVLFHSSIEKAKELGPDTLFLEMAAHPVLSVSMRQCGIENIVYSMHREENEQVTMLKAIGKFSGKGFSLNWNNVCGQAERIDSIPYPFQRRLCFSENEFHAKNRFVPEFKVSASPFLGMRSHNSSETWKNIVNTRLYPFLQDHVVQDTVIFPGAGYVEFALEALGNHLEHIEILFALVVPTDSTFVHVELVKSGDSVSIFTKKENDTKWVENGRAKLKKSKIHPPNMQLKELQDKCPKYLNKDAIYKRFEVMGLTYGPSFQCIQGLYQGDEESFGILTTSNLEPGVGFVLHPSILDCSFQCFLGSIKNCSKTYLPVGMDNLDVFDKIPSEVYVYCNVTEINSKNIKGNITGFDKDGKVLFQVIGFTGNAIPQKMNVNNLLLTSAWQTKSFPNIDFISQHVESKEWNESIQYIPLLGQMISYYLSKFLSKIPTDTKLDVHQERHLNWCKNFLKENLTTHEPENIPVLDLECQAIKRVGENFHDLILNKNNAVANVMFSDDLLTKVYSDSPTFRPTLEAFVPFLEQALTKEPNRVIRILEVGGGTGGLTKHLFELLKKYAGGIEYFFTDLSSKFFDQTQKRFGDITFARYKVLDIEKSLSDQGISPYSIDIVVGFDVVHACMNLKKSLNFIHEAIAPNGLLMLI